MEKCNSNYPPNFNPYYNEQNPMFYGNGLEAEQMINPVSQYEQMYMYYKYLTQQMEYKLRCIEFDNLSKISENKKIN